MHETIFTMYWALSALGNKKSFSLSIKKKKKKNAKVVTVVEN